MDILNLIGRSTPLFDEDISKNEKLLVEIIQSSSFLVLGGAGSIGNAVTKEIFKRNPQKLHVVDISENSLVELVRDIRSSIGYISGEFKTFALDIGSQEYDVFMGSDGQYDYVLNLSALKHVRSEKDPFTLMRMINVNIFNTLKSVRHAIRGNAKKYFCVSTDKAANPVNMMGASKRIMELFLMRESREIDISTARFANVAFSNGSLLDGFNQRIEKRQPIVAPNDIRRYFVTPQESGELCLMSCLLGDNKEIFFPKLNDKLHLTTFAEIADKYLNQLGYKVHECENEEEARNSVVEMSAQGKWPCLFTKSDTTGEKDFEEFYMEDEKPDLTQYQDIGVIESGFDVDYQNLDNFENTIAELKSQNYWTKQNLVDLFNKTLPSFKHMETGKYLDSKM